MAVRLLDLGRRPSWYGPTVVVDAACGTGRAIEEIARIGGIIMEDVSGVHGRIRAIGVDLNPLPNRIPKSVLSLDHQTGMERKKPTLPRAKFHRDDLRTLRTIKSGSVDVLYSVGGFYYVDDTLKALESGWRVLKEGADEGREGFMVYEVPMLLISDPDIRTIIGTTRGASESFSVPPVPNPLNDYSDRFPFVVGRKKEGNEFMGFPWRLVGVKPFLNNDKPHHKHAVTGIYEPIKTDERYASFD